MREPVLATNYTVLCSWTQMVCLAQLLGDQTEILGDKTWRSLKETMGLVHPHLSVGLYPHNANWTITHFKEACPVCTSTNLYFPLGWKVESRVWTCMVTRNILGVWFIWRLFGHEGSRSLFIYLSSEVEPWFTSQNLHCWFKISLTGLCIYYSNIFRPWKVGGEQIQPVPRLFPSVLP